MEQMMHHQWVVEHQEEEEEEEEPLVGRKSLMQHPKDDIVVTTGDIISNGTSLASVEEPHTLKEEEEEIEETSNVVENDNNHLNDDFVAVVEFLGTAENGEAIKSASTTTTIDVAPLQNKNSVYFDEQQGNEVDAASSVLSISHGKREFDKQLEISDIQSSPSNEVNIQCMNTIDDKVPSGSELSPSQNSSEAQAKTVIENFSDESSAKAHPNNLMKEIDQKLEELDVEAVLEKQETHDLFCPNCHSCITKRVILRKRKRNIANFNAKAKRENSDIQLVDDGSVHEAKQGGNAIASSDVGRQEQEPPADNVEPEREAEVFRCLSCFSFFIPFRNGIKLFPNFGATHETETSQSPLVIPTSNMENPSNIETSNTNWFFKIFTFNKGMKAREQGNSSIENSGTGLAEQNNSSSITNVLTSLGIGDPESPLADTIESKNVNSTPDVKAEDEGANSPIPSKVKSVTIESWKEKGNKSSMALGDQNDLSENSNDLMNGLVKLGKDSKDFSAKEQLVTEIVRTSVVEKNNDSVDMIKTDIVADISSKSLSDDKVSKPQSVLLATVAATKIHFNAAKAKPAKDANAIIKSILEKSQKDDVDKIPEIVQNSHSSLMQEVQSPAKSFGGIVVAGVANEKQSSGVIAAIPSVQDLKEVLKDIEEEIVPSVIKEKKEALKSLTSQTVVNVPVEGAIVTETHTQIYIGEQPRVETGQPQQWELLKSIVYGGLIESITSLGIVSSAAGSGSSPLNIIALGLANLIGGLFIIAHDLIELKNGHFGGASQQTNIQEDRDRYQELLGRRSHYLLHTIVAVLSFLIFGSIPIVVYGLLISKQYYDEVKIAAVVATSMVCIILLASGKVYTTRPPKSYMKTVLQYVTMAIAASGISYIGGDLLKLLLEKFTHSESGFVLGMNLSETRRMKPAWVSY